MELEHVHLVLIELKFPIFGLKWSNIEHSSTFHYANGNEEKVVEGNLNRTNMSLFM